MTKQKKSFFEKLTGIQKIEDASEIEVTDSSDIEDENDLSDDETPLEPPHKQKIEEDEDEDKDKDEDEDEDKDEDDFFQKNDNQEDFSNVDDEEDLEDSFVAPEPTLPKKTGKEEDESEIDSEGQLTIDVYQTDKDIVIKSTIAGVKAEDLDVDINSEMVTIKGKRSQEEEVDSESYYYQECYWGPFSRSIILPVEIVTGKAEASMKNGILTIRLPKMEAAKTRKLQVRGF